jgi:NitT/TauT family transport system permease protein
MHQSARGAGCERSDIGGANMNHTFMRTLRFWLPAVVASLSVLAVWELAGRALSIKDYLLPVPTKILAAATNHSGSLLQDSLFTFAESGVALVLASLLAFGAAVLFQLSVLLRRAFLPLAIVSKSVPIVVFAPLFALWFGYGPSGKVALAVVVAFLPIAVNATFGMDAVAAEQLDLFRLHRASKWKEIWKLRLPNAVAFIIPALRLSATLAVLGVVIAEMTGAKAGLGATILITSATLDTPLLFAAALCALLVCGALLVGISLLESVALRRFRYDLKNNLTKL